MTKLTWKLSSVDVGCRSHETVPFTRYSAEREDIYSYPIGFLGPHSSPCYFKMTSMGWKMHPSLNVGTSSGIAKSQEQPGHSNQ